MPDLSTWSEFIAGLDAADICGVLIDIDSSAVAWAGPRFSDFAGMTPEGVLNLKAESLFPPQSLDALSELHATGPVREFALQVITADRGLCRATADLNPVVLANREYTLVKIHRARTQAESLGSDMQFRALVDTLPTPALIWRPDTYQVLYINRALEDIWGYPRAHIVGRRVDEFLVDIEQMKHQIEKRLRDATYSPVEFQVRDETNSIRTWIASSSVITYDNTVALITAVTDVTAREKMAEALRRSEQSFSLLVNSVPEGIVVHCDGRVVFANPVALEMADYESLNEMRDVPVIELIHPEDRPKVVDRMRAVIEDQLHAEPMHERILRRDGSWIDVEITASPTEFDGKPAALIIARDISERLARDAALRDSEMKYRTIVESVNDTIFQLDASGRFTFFSNNENPDFLTFNDIVGRPFTDFVHPDDLTGLRESYRDTLEGRLQPHEFRVKAKVDGWRHVRTSSRPIYDSQGTVAGLIGVMIDLTDRITQENALRESAAKLEEATQLARISTWELNPESGRWAMSHEIWDILGVGDLSERDRAAAFMEMVPEEDFDRIRRLTLEAVERTGQFETEFRCMLPGGEVRHLRTAAHVERSADGKPSRVYGATQDITAQKRQEDERLQIEVQLQRAQKLDSLNVLAGGVAHDFNNLLTGILGYSELLKNAVEHDEKSGKYVDEIQAITHRAAELTRQLLAYSGRGKFVVKPLDLPAMIKEFAPLIEAVIPKDVRLLIESDEAAPMVTADSTQIKQILMNLVLNAAESFEGRAGSVRVSTRARTIDLQPAADSNHPLPAVPGNYVMVQVADDGVGMTPEQLKRVCDPFYSTKFVGRGLGLSAVHGIVQSHHGGLHISSKPRRGTTVEILLPASTESSEKLGTTSAVDESSCHTVLVVDDERAVRNVMTDILESAGFAVMQACDGKECLDVLVSDDANIDLVILDLTMPRMNGEQTLERLREEHPRTPVILASGYSQQEMQERFNGNGPSAFLQKPFNAKLLLDTVRAGFSDSAQ